MRLLFSGSHFFQLLISSETIFLHKFGIEEGAFQFGNFVIHFYKFKTELLLSRFYWLKYFVAIRKIIKVLHDNFPCVNAGMKKKKRLGAW